MSGAEKNEVSVHEVLVYKALLDAAPKWRSNNQLAADVKKIAAGLKNDLTVTVATRTIRAHTAKLVQLGIVDQAEVFPGHRYRITQRDDKRSGRYVGRLEETAKIIELDL